jgi:tetratricopeptide (TPR) repeat protein
VARTVLVTAPAGAGKSRVRHELLDRIQFSGERFELLVGRGDALRAGAPFTMIAPALRAAASLVGGEPAEIACKRLLAHVRRHLPADKAPRIAAFLGEIADIPFPDDELPALRAARQDPRLMADQTLAAWLDFLEAECQAHPVLLVLEDLHWGDAPSVQFIDAALRTLREKPLMVLAFARPEVDDKFANLWIERDLQRISLPPLTPRSAQKLVRAAVADMSAEEVAWIVERADGNPFYLEELVRAVGSGVGKHALPETVIGMVQARFDALGPDAKRVLRAAAVFGQTFRSAGVKKLLGGDEDRCLDEWLDNLVQKEVLFSRRAGDSKELVFRHALLQEAAYNMLTAEDRVLGHRLAGEYLEGAGEREAILLVEHYERGGERAKAAHWCRFATEQALEANDLDEVIIRARRGVRLGATGETLGAARLAEAQAHFWRGEYREGEISASEALETLTGEAQLRASRELFSALGQQAKFADVESRVDELRRQGSDPASTGAWLDCLVRAVAYLLPGGLYDAANSTIAEVEKHAGLLESASRARLEGLRAIRAWHEGNQSGAIAGLATAVRSYEALGDLRSATEMQANLGTALADLGLLEEAEERLIAALTIAERMGLKFITAAVLMNLSLLRAHCGRFDEASATGARALELAREQGDLRIEGITQTHLAIAASLKGDPQAAEVHARSATQLLATVPPALPAALAVLSQSLLSQGRAQDALKYAKQAYDLLEEHGRVEDGEALIRLAYGQSLAAVGLAEEASRVLQAARLRLNERAAAIKNPAWREAFLRRPPAHAETLGVSQRAGSAPQDPVDNRESV